MSEEDPVEEIEEMAKKKYPNSFASTSDPKTEVGGDEVDGDNLELAKDEAQPDFKKHTRGYLLHETEPVGPMTEEEAIEYLIKKDVPQSVWQTWDEGNRPKMVICSKEQLPSTREWRNAWRISDDLTTLDEAA